MNKISPVLTEKSLANAKDGKYTFWVERRLTKDGIKILINQIFDVNVTSIKTINVAGSLKKNYRGRKRLIQPRKKAIVTLKEKQKIDLFEDGKK